jgi:hypothetical protein
MARFDTVVLFDVENLLGAPEQWKQAAAKLSFRDILNQLRGDASGTIGRFAVSRAYANWGRGFMEALRREMTENGIEPRQIFGFDRTGRKNAADIELVIDAMDLAYLRPEISTFVIVSRDGGFASLARKLHELGKSVVVCADSECSLALRSVADVFIELPEPGEELAPVAEDRGPAEVGATERDLDDARELVIQEIRALVRESERFETEGIPLQDVGTRFRDAIPSLGLVRSGFRGLREFLQWALVGTEFCVIRWIDGPQGAKDRLGPRKSVPRGFERLPNLGKELPIRFRDQATLYRYLAGQGKPHIRLAEPPTIARVLSEVAKSRQNGEELRTTIDRTAAELAGTVPAEDVKFTLLALDSGETRPGMTAAQLRSALLTTVRRKLETRLDPIDDSVLESLID